MKVLIVDDDPLILEMYTLKLRKAGFDVEVASDGRQGLEKIRAGGLGVILLDVVLPLVDGFEILETLRREGIGHPPVILLTNLGQKEDVERGMALGAVDYVIKAHFTPSEVVEKIESILKEKKS